MLYIFFFRWNTGFHFLNKEKSIFLTLQHCIHLSALPRWYLTASANGNGSFFFFITITYIMWTRVHDLLFSHYCRLFNLLFIALFSLCHETALCFSFSLALYLLDWIEYNRIFSGTKHKIWQFHRIRMIKRTNASKHHFCSPHCNTNNRVQFMSWYFSILFF